MLTGFVNLGPQRHRGTSTVRYRLTFERASAEAVVTVPPAAPPSEDVQVEIDHRGRLRRYVRMPSPDVQSVVALWDHGQPSPLDIPDDARRRLGAPPGDPARADQSLLTVADLPGYAIGSVPAVQAETYASCWPSDGLLDPANGDRLASAEAPGFRQGSTHVGVAVIVGRAPVESITAYRELAGVPTLSCLAQAFQSVVEAETGLVLIDQSSGLLREPPLAGQSIGHWLDFGIGSLERRVVAAGARSR